MKHPTIEQLFRASYKRVFRKPVILATQFNRATAAHSTPALVWIKATLSLKLEREKPRPIESKLTPQTVRKLLSSFKIGGNQSNFVDARTTHDVDGFGDIGKPHCVITLDERNLFSAFLEHIGKARTQ